MFINRLVLVCVATLGFCAIGRAQPALLPPVERGVAEPAPLIDDKAQLFVEQMVARYAALKSYSDVTQVGMENAAGEPVQGVGNEWSFRATLQWERPANIRFEGKNAQGAFLALGTPADIRVVSAQFPKNYVARPRSETTIATNADGAPLELPPQTVRLEEPLMGNSIPGAPSLGFMLDAGFWQRTRKDVRSLQFDPDARADDQDCRVLRLQLAFDDGGKAVSRAFVAKSDGLLRRVEMRDDRMPADTLVVETHSDVETNPDLPASTWNFTAPTAATAVDYFSRLDENKLMPDIKIGDSLPTFSADALDGAPLELNAKSGKVTVVYFFTMNSGIYDVQILRKIQQLVGADKLQMIGVSGDGVRPRVEKWTESLELNFPIYFDEGGMRNALAQKFGFKGWASIFIFGADGKLKFIDGSASGAEFQKNLRALLPQIGRDDYILQDGEFLQAP